MEGAISVLRRVKQGVGSSLVLRGLLMAEMGVLAAGKGPLVATMTSRIAAMGVPMEGMRARIAGNGVLIAGMGARIAGDDERFIDAPRRVGRR